MKLKIKSLGLSGIAGILMIILSLYFLTGLFRGTTNVQTYFANRRSLAEMNDRIATLELQLERVNLHIRLMQEQSPDFISEMAARHLNLADPNAVMIRN